MNEAPGAPAGIDYKKEFEREQERLARLFDAYEAQEKELQASKERITKLEETINEKERVVRSLREVLTSRDADNRELQIELSALRTEKASWDPRLRELEANIRLEKDRFGNLFKLAMELDAELKEAKGQIDARDRWYKKNVLVMSNIKRAMDEHDKMIQAAQGRPYEPDLEGELLRLKGESDVPK